MSEEVIVSGLEADFVAFKAPSGQWGVDLDAFLVSFNASFGFNESPHRFSFSFIPSEFNGASGNLPDIGTYFTYEVRPGNVEAGFYIAGKVTHADYSNNAGGTSIGIEVEDRRKDILDQVYITTEDLGQNAPSGLVSVAEMYRIGTGFLDTSGNISDSRVKEYRNIVELGATYQEIYNALILASGLGRTDFVTTRLPHPDLIAANMRGTIEPLRFKFVAEPLSRVITTVCSDAGYDWYWGMADDTVKIVNRQYSFIVNEDNLAIQQLSPDNVDFKFGTDEVQNPSKVTVLGAKREGFINSRLLSPIDGIAEPTGQLMFVPAWNNISISFYDNYGVYRTYTPNDKELQMALKSIEHWAYYKKYQDTVFGYPTDEGVTAAQHSTFESRIDPLMPLADFYNNPASGLRIISNRLDEEHNWILEWYSRISNHASTHYGKTYVLEGFSYNANSGELVVLDAAWCNLENQIQNSSSLFTENYQINPLYAPVTPFVTDEFKVRAHAVLPSSTKYGYEGYDAPASFSDWNEDAHPSGDQTYEHYIPVDLKIVGQKIINPRSEENAFEDFPEGTIIAQFPVLVGSGRYTDAILQDLVTLYEIGQFLGQSGIEDIYDPTILVQAHSGISGVAIPIQIQERFGQIYPAAWSSGTGSGAKCSFIVNDAFAPWNYFPVGSSNSLEVMGQRVSGYMAAQIVPVNSSRFAEINKVDWPFIGFDSFANQLAVSGVYGTRDHGVTEITVSFSAGVPRTTYGIKSFFSDFIKDAPLGERNFGILNNVIHPIDYMQVNNPPSRPLGDNRPIGGRSPTFSAVPPIAIRKEVYAVTITQVFNRGDTTAPERYWSITKDNIPKPGGSTDPLDSEDLICRDGFLNVGDKCLYHVEYNALGRRRRFYTGGTDLTQGAAVVEVSTIDTVGNTVDITYRGFTIPAVEVIPGADVNALSTGDFGSLQTDGTMHPDNNANITGLRPEVDAPTGTYFVPVGAAGGAGTATPVIIIDITNFGTSGATATVQEIIPSGNSPDFVGSGTLTAGVRPIPIAQFAQSGDVGVLTENSAGDQFIFINRQAFAIYGG